MMPALIDSPMPSGLPTAITWSPTCRRSLSPHRTVGSGVSESIFSSARSMLSETPMLRAGRVRPSCRVALISITSLTT